HQLSLVELPLDAEELPDYQALRDFAETFHGLVREGKIISAKYLGQGGLAPALATCAFGNDLGAEITGEPRLFAPRPCQFIVEHAEELPPIFQSIGRVIAAPELRLHGETLDLNELKKAWEGTLEPVYPTTSSVVRASSESPVMRASSPHSSESAVTQTASPRFSGSSLKPKVIIPVFPGTNCEYDTARVFREAGAEPQILVFRNLSAPQIEDSLNELAAAISQSQILMLPGGFSAGDEPDGSAKFIATILRNPRVADAVMDLLKNRDGLALGICNGFQALVKTGLLPHGEICETSSESATLTHNTIGRHISTYVTTRVANLNSPWLANCELGELHTVPVSHGEGRFIAPEALQKELLAKGHIAFQYVDSEGQPTMDEPWNPNGSDLAIEGLSSPCGRILGKMAHTERRGQDIAKNIHGNKHQALFKAGVSYFA
ncbi:MAG: phosphoribosylformylglycinamidine synthase subunit PurQ, partial [Verrucomicrobiales bacterium]